jgi:hypothetical protein
MKTIPPPDEFLRDRFLTELAKEKIVESFRNELRWLNEYKNVIEAFRASQLNEVVSKANFLISACVRKDNKAIDEFICQFGRVEDDSIKLDYEKILENYDTKRSSK